jgi:50S ribosomal protein L16 3-hydroxylase
MFFLKGIYKRTFYRDFWRKAPLYCPSGGARLFPSCMSPACLTERVLARARRDANYSDGGSGTQFVQRADRYLPELRSIVSALARDEGFSSLWFDAVATAGIGGIGGIGRHFDDSDNFVFQQQGLKRWRVELADRIPEEHLRARMLGEPGWGTLAPGQCMGSRVFEWELRPGDMLYIPLFCPHEGVSTGPSFSVSLVCGAYSPFTLLGPMILSEVPEKAEMYRPLPYAGTMPEQAFVAEVRRRVSALFDGDNPSASVERITNAIQARVQRDREILVGWL